MNTNDIARIAGLVGEPTRTAMLIELMDGRALTAGELARSAGVGAPTASRHLALMVEGGLVRGLGAGRHRYYRLASREVAAIIEAMMQLAASTTVAGRSPPGRRTRGCGAARTCYDHLAGQTRGGDRRSPRRGRRDRNRSRLRAADAGAAAVLAALDPDLVDGDIDCRPCMDWAERRPHLAGPLAIRICQHLLARGWLRRPPRGRAVEITGDGARHLGNWLGARRWSQVTERRRAGGACRSRRRRLQVAQRSVIRGAGPRPCGTGSVPRAHCRPIGPSTSFVSRIDGLDAVQPDHELRPPGGDLLRVPAATRPRCRLGDGGDLDDRPGRVGLVGTLVEDVRLVASLVGELPRILAPEVDAAVGVVAGPELGPQVEVAIASRVTRNDESLPPCRRLDRAIGRGPVGVADAVEVLQAARAIDRRCHEPPTTGGAAGSAITAAHSTARQVLLLCISILPVSAAGKRHRRGRSTRRAATMMANRAPGCNRVFRSPRPRGLG